MSPLRPKTRNAPTAVKTPAKRIKKIPGKRIGVFHRNQSPRDLQEKKPGQKEGKSEHGNTPAPAAHLQDVRVAPGHKVMSDDRGLQAAQINLGHSSPMEEIHFSSKELF
jgi:hypothetical protein